MKNTALQTALTRVNEIPQGINYDGIDFVRKEDVTKILESLLPVERQQIVDAYNHAWENADLGETANDYFTQTYEK